MWLGGCNEALSFFLSVFLTVSHLQSFKLLISRHSNFRQQSANASAVLHPSRTQSPYWDISSSARLMFCSVTGKLWKDTHQQILAQAKVLCDQNNSNWTCFSFQEASSVLTGDVPIRFFYPDKNPNPLIFSIY